MSFDNEGSSAADSVTDVTDVLATDFVTDVTDVTDFRKKEDGRRKTEDGRSKRAYFPTLPLSHSSLSHSSPFLCFKSQDIAD
ncbi:hypothetical protein QUB68_12660 [Microcoleus sp. A006_D1]|uniref:hypothetical protein n=1 Tax=Microcoleus sp. A006_D1 TaxID=3055267 RepID=UPI002FD79B97